MSRTHACLRHLLGLSDFDVDSIEVAGDKVRPGSSYYQGFVATRIGCCYRLLWWYSQAMKRNHLLLSPFLAPFDPIRGEMFRSSLLLVKYATMLASATILYHLHTCFSLQRSVMAAFSTTGTEKAELDIVSQQWWIGRLLLVVLSMSMQKVPVIMLLGMFKVEHVS